MSLRHRLRVGPSPGAVVAAAVAVALVSASASARPDPPPEAEVRRLIDDLGDSDIPRRYEAAKRLAEIGRPAVEPLRKAAADHPSEDVRQRAAIVARDVERASFTEVRTFEGHVPGEGWRQYVTRVVATPDGKRIL